MKTKWVKIYEKDKKYSCVRIVYNPGLKSLKEVIKFWIPEEFQKDVKACYIK